MIIRDLVDCLFPSVCPACRFTAGQTLCDGCIETLPFLKNPCPYCASERPDGATSCGECHDAGIPGLRHIQTVGAYTGILERLINDAKAGARPAALKALASLAAEQADVSQMEAVIPIPPNPGRREGQHLATACAQAITQRHKLPLIRCLRTQRAAAEQHRLNLGDRKKAVDGLFECSSDISFQRVLLVDDIYTSGNTLRAASKALRYNQQAHLRINAFCLSRTLKQHAH